MEDGGRCHGSKVMLRICGVFATMRINEKRNLRTEAVVFFETSFVVSLLDRDI
jgi:hypothetical protein